MARRKKVPHAAIAADAAEAKKQPKAQPSQRAVSAKARVKAQKARAKTGSAVAGAGNRGGKGASGKLASRTSKAKRDRDARRAGIPKPKPSSKPPVTKGGSKHSSKGSHKGKTKSKNTKNRNPKNVPVTAPPPTTVDDTKIVRTQRQGVPVTGTPFTSNIIEQEQDILNAFLTLSGTELFQYTNSKTIDGMFDDVSIISVLSSRRKAYSPNTIIETMVPVIKSVTREGDILHVVVERSVKGRVIVMEFYVGSHIVEIGSEEYV
jgi:hypothetical protein